MWLEIWLWTIALAKRICYLSNIQFNRLKPYIYFTLYVAYMIFVEAKYVYWYTALCIIATMQQFTFDIRVNDTVSYFLYL